LSRALFDAVRTAAMGIWGVVTEIADLVVAFLDAKWKIPFVTPVFEWFPGQEFSLMNAFTFLVCRVFGLIVGEDNVTKFSTSARPQTR
jgi:hypothetical protein